MRAFQAAPLAALILLPLTACIASYGSSGNLDLKAVNFSELPKMKKGEACTTTFLILTSGKSTVSEAAAQGGINTVEHIEYSSASFAGPLFYKNCVTVYGK